MQASTGRPFPNPSQELLLKAALMDRDVALPSWNEWRKSVDFELDVDHGSFRLLPLVYQNLSSFEYSDDLVDGRLKGIYRQAWIKNQQLFYKTAKVLKTLHEADIKTAVLKGIALTELVYKNYGTRPMADMDILVPFPEAHRAIKMLRRVGFELQDEHLLEHNLEYGRSISYKDKEGTEIDLHWHPLHHSHANITESDFWDHAVPIEIAEVKTHALCPTDNLFHAIVHGIRKNPEPPIRWIADAITMIHSDDIEIDWQRLLSYASRLRVYLQVKKALIYLSEHFKANIPQQVMNELHAYRPSYVERVVFRHGEKIGDNAQEITFTNRIYSFYVRYLIQTSRKGFFSIHMGFLTYAADRLRTRLTE